MDGNLIQGIIMVVLLVMSAFFSATETSFSALNRTRLKNMAEKGNKRAEAALKLAENYDSLLSSILVGNNIVNISMASIGTVMFVNLLGSSSGPTVSTIVCTVVVLIFGEITPKSVAKEMPENFEQSDQIAHANLCGFGKSVIQAVLEGKVEQLARTRPTCLSLPVRLLSTPASRWPSITATWATTPP